MRPKVAATAAPTSMTTTNGGCQPTVENAEFESIAPT